MNAEEIFTQLIVLTTKTICVHRIKDIKIQLASEVSNSKQSTHTQALFNEDLKYYECPIYNGEINYRKLLIRLSLLIERHKNKIIISLPFQTDTINDKPLVHVYYIVRAVSQR